MTKLIWLNAILVAAMLGFTPLAGAAADPQQSAEASAVLDINSADAQAIAAALDGVGLVKAQEIVAYREMFGAFQSVDELAEVKGIGLATVEKNRQRIVIVKN